MAFLTDNGTCTYNGVPIVGPGGSPVKTKITGKPLYDESNRAIKYMEYSLSVRGYVTSDGTGTSDTKWDALRVLLETPRRPLIYTSKGFGTLSVNVPGGTVKDVCWGPHPGVVEFTPIGDSV